MDGTGCKMLLKLDPKLASQRKVGVLPNPKLVIDPAGSMLLASLFEGAFGKLLVIKLNDSALKAAAITDETSDPMDAVFLPDGKKIMFSSPDPADDGQVYLNQIDADGQNKKLFKRDAFSAEYSSDGSRILFERGNAILVCNADGSAERVVLELHTSSRLRYPFRPSFNPANANEIIFMGGDAGGIPVITTVSTVDGSQRTLTTGLEDKIVPLFASRFTPDGRKVIFSVLGTEKRADLYVANADGGAARKLTEAAGYQQFFEPAVSPVGTTIYFLAEEART
jgi:Tol biopolymer transport system component